MKKLILLTMAVFTGSVLFSAVPAPVLDIPCATGDMAKIKDVSANAAKVTVIRPEKLSWRTVENDQLLTFSGNPAQPRPMLLVTNPTDFKFNAPFTLQIKFRTAADHNQKARNQLMQHGYGADRISGFSIFLFMKSLHFRFGTESKTGVKSNAKIVPIMPDTEYNAVIVYDTKTVAIYLNGKLVLPPKPAQIPAVTQKTFTVGATASTGGGYAFQGSLRNIKVYNQALSIVEATKL
ncbi:MAG: LamG domain-containing protein [Lentisphaerae bacterium]|nr:LamG domain-containing protein [Lentisphaerota bacterium]